MILTKSQIIYNIHMENKPDNYEHLIESGITSPHDLDVLLGNRAELEEKMFEVTRNGPESLNKFIGQLPYKNPIQEQAIETLDDMVSGIYLGGEEITNKERWEAINVLSPLPTPLYIRCAEEIIDNAKDEEEYLGIILKIIETLNIFPNDKLEEVLLKALNKLVDLTENKEKLEIVLSHAGHQARGWKEQWGELRIKTLKKLLS